MFPFSRLIREGFALFALALALSSPTIAAAQDASSAAAAEALFREGRQLMDAGRFSEACPKFQASYELDVALGTLLNLANCFQLDGHVASAWARFIEAETMARRANDPRAQVARDRATALEPRLVRVRVIVRHPIDGLSVQVAGREFARPTWGSAIPIDPGEVTLLASAPGHDPYSQTFTAVTEGETVDVEVPALVPSPFEEHEEEILPQSRTQGPPPEHHNTSVRPLGFAIGGVGVASLAIGFGLGANANALWDPDACPSVGGVRTCRTAAAQADAESARTRANASTGLVIAGGALVVTGLIMVIAGGGSDDAPAASRVTVVPVASANGGGLVVGGSF